MLDLRSDVSTMKQIVERYRLWRPRNPETELKAFSEEFIRKRYGTSIGSTRQDRLQAAFARRALDFYVHRLDPDGDHSLLAVLGALSEAEGFSVRPIIVMRRVYHCRNDDIPTYIFGGYGIENLDQAFRAAKQDLRARPAEVTLCPVRPGRLRDSRRA